jgi:hypothetical protein
MFPKLGAVSACLGLYEYPGCAYSVPCLQRELNRVVCVGGFAFHGVGGGNFSERQAWGCVCSEA